MKIGFKRLFVPAVRFLEKVMALVVLACVLVSLVKGGITLASMDWSAKETFYELIYRILLLVIGLELVRMLITHSLGAVLELLAFVVLLAGRKHLMSPTCYEAGELADETAGESRAADTGRH